VKFIEALVRVPVIGKFAALVAFIKYLLGLVS